MNAEILSVGTELLLGNVANTDARRHARESYCPRRTAAGGACSGLMRAGMV